MLMRKDYSLGATGEATEGRDDSIHNVLFYLVRLKKVGSIMGKVEGMNKQSQSQLIGCNNYPT